MRYLTTMHHERKKYIRGNNKPFMAKALSKAIMQRTHLRNKFLKNPTNQNRLIHTKQRNLCLSLLRNKKKEYFGNLNKEGINDNKKFSYTRPISILPIISKIFEKLICRQL